MNMKILGLLGILAVVSVPCVVSYAASEDVEEIDEFDEEDEEFDDEFEEDEDEELGEEDEESDTEEEDKESESSASTTGRAVKSRETCDDIKKRVNELRADVVAHPELQEELDTLLVRQRACAPRANRRPVRNYDNVNPVTAVTVTSVEDAAPEPAVVDTEKKKAKKPKKEKSAEPVEQKLTPEENLAKGLCADGTAPNRYGCCANERFKQVSTMVFACCPKEGDGECHEPLNKKQGVKE